MSVQCMPSGPRDARIMVVGEAPGTEDARVGRPFTGVAGEELSRMLHDAGIIREECFLTNVARIRPPGNDTNLLFINPRKREPGVEILTGLELLKKEIENVNPSIIIALGNLSLWALTGHWGVTTWRGSVLPSKPEFGNRKILPTLHPSYILRQWDQRFIAVQDLRRARRESLSREFTPTPFVFTVRPSFSAVTSTLSRLLVDASDHRIRLAGDLETRGGHIACIGIAWDRYSALCIPFMCVERPDGYWTREEEFAIIRQLRDLLTHPNVEIVGQNWLYDLQYIAKWWGFTTHTYMDTMLAHHVCWPGMQKGLDFLASMYCEQYTYWKDEGKNWDKNLPEEQLWVYNCTDACRTFEVSQALDETLTKLSLRPQFEFQMRVFHSVFRMMLRGVRIDHDLRSKLVWELMTHVADRKNQITHLAGFPLNPNSPKQLATYFYDTLGIPEIRSRKTGSRTCDADALETIARREPIARRLVYSIIESRQLANSLSVVQTPLDTDRRLRCSYNISGTETFRFSSSENAFGSGTNLQNITKGGISPETGLRLPNLRELFIPDTGRIIVDVDLDRADLQVVVWEADDSGMKDALRAGVDMHLRNARDLYSIDIPDDEIVESHPKCGEHAERYDSERYMAKRFVHATNYGGKARTVGAACGITTHQCELLQRRWFAAHPGIREWHRRTEMNLATRREVRNAFGFRRFYFDRVDAILPEALAWIPQSTVALVINHGLVALDTKCPDVELLLQVHDSLDFQIPIPNYLSRLESLRPHLLITVPYPDPLIIPVGFKISQKSWGSVKKI